MTFVCKVFHRLKLFRLVQPFNDKPIFLRVKRTQLTYSANNYIHGRAFRDNCTIGFTTNEYIGKRFKHKKTKKTEDDSDSDDDLSDSEGSDKLVTGHVTSLRADTVLKAGLGMARNKVETNFYESRIRVNGKKLLKKSQKVEIGDELDIVKGRNPMNENLLNVSRIVLVSAKENDDGDKLLIKMKRYKDLTIEDYEG